MSRAKKHKRDCFIAVGQCACGRLVGLCMAHRKVMHQPPECAEFRSMETEEYLDYVTVSMRKREFERADSEEWPRA